MPLVSKLGEVQIIQLLKRAVLEFRFSRWISSLQSCEAYNTCRMLGITTRFRRCPMRSTKCGKEFETEAGLPRNTVSQLFLSIFLHIPGAGMDAKSMLGGYSLHRKHEPKPLPARGARQHERRTEGELRPACVQRVEKNEAAWRREELSQVTLYASTICRLCGPDEGPDAPRRSCGVPGTIARTMRRPVAPVMSVTTW